jgi:UDP-N-acetylmuramate dehydrogenase
MSAGMKWRSHFAERLGCRVCYDEPLASHTTLGVGGSVPLMAWLDSEQVLVAACRFLDSVDLSWRLLGSGSNVLVADSGLSGAVLRLAGRMSAIEIIDENRRSIDVQVGGGASLARVVAWGRKRGAGGLDALYGIPGTLGGAVKLNAGTRRGTIADQLIEVRLLSGGRLSWLPAGRLGFGYRRSSIGRRRVVVAARLRLQRRTPLQIERALAEARKQRSGQPRGWRSAGCFFMNPEGGSAGKLIELAGCKGERLGGALVSGRHANFIINTGAASAADIWRLSGRVARRVRLAFGVRLQREVELWGRFRTGPSAGRQA